MSPIAAPRVCLVDNDPNALAVMERHLHQHGCIVSPVEDGQAAVDAAVRGNVDVVVSDITMPGLDGFALLRLLGALAPTVPCVLVTSTPSLEAALQALDNTAIALVPKAAIARDLGAAVLRAMDRRGHAQRVAQAFELVDERAWAASAERQGPSR